MTKETAILYGVDIESSPLVRHRTLLKDYVITGVVSPVGWGFCGKDAAVIDGGEATGILVEEDYSEALKKCETVLLCDCKYNTQVEEQTYAVMREALAAGKNVVCLAESDHPFLELSQLAGAGRTCIRFGDTLTEKENPFLNYRNTFKISGWEYKGKSHVYERLHKIETPVIFIMGMTEQNGKFELQLALREALTGQGYQVGQIGTRKYCELMGFHSFPRFMSEPHYNEVEKILMFNRLLSDIEKQEQPDVIIVGIPGGMAKVNNFFTNKFGIYAYEISQAVDPDYVIMNTYYENFTQEYLDNVMLAARHRYGFDVDCFGLSNTKVDWGDVMKANSDIFIKISSRLVSDKLLPFQKSEVPLFDVLSSEQITLVVQRMIGRLNGYADIEVI